MLTEEDLNLHTSFRNLSPNQRIAAFDFLRATFYINSAKQNKVCKIQICAFSKFV